jgi:hypothetical protein
MRKLLLAGTAVLLMATSALAQSSMPRSIVSRNQFCTYGNSGAQVCVPLAVRQMRAAQRGPKRTRR